MKKVVIAVLILAAALVAYKLAFKRHNYVLVTLAEQNASGESGTAKLWEKDGKVVVAIKVTGEPEGADQPAHIHVGACPNPGAVLHPLTNVVDGKSETTLNTTLAELEAKGPLAINLHKSAAESKVYIACGDIVFADKDDDAEGTPMGGTTAKPGELTAKGGTYACEEGKTFTMAVSGNTATVTGADVGTVRLTKSEIGIWKSADAKFVVREIAGYTVLVENDVTTHDRCRLR